MKHAALRIASLFLTSLLTLMFAQMASAQTTTGEIKGKVIDAFTKEPLVGAQVFIRDTKIGAATNIDGQYTLRRLQPGEYVLVARYVGYRSVSKNVTVSAGASAQVDFELVPSAVQADELVVTGQGVATEKRKLTTAVEFISSDRITGSPTKSIDQLLQGNVPGLTAQLPSGVPGVGARIQTRGVKSALNSTNPVIYVDGVRVDNGDNFAGAFGRGGQVSSALADLLVGDNIERIEIIKGGAASTLYGSDGANGVIQIFTKKGAAGEAKWNVGIVAGADTPELRWLYTDYLREAYYQNAFFQQYRLGVTGGSEALSYNINGKLQDSRGIVTGDRVPDRAFNVAAGLKAIASDKADVEISTSLTRTQFGSLLLNNAFNAYNSIETEARLDPYVLGVVRGLDVSTPQRLRFVQDSLFQQWLIPDFSEQVTRSITTLNFNYAPFREFTNRFTVGVDYRYNEARDIIPVNPGEAFGPLGSISRSSRDFTQITLAYTGNYKLPELGPISAQVAFGFQGFRQETREVSAQGSQIAPGTRDFDNAAVITASEIISELFTGGVFINPIIGINDRIFIDLGLRIDGSTAFGQDITYLPYPKIGIAWNVSEEAFYPDVLREFLTSVKLRGSFGSAGEFPPPFLRDRTFAINPYLGDVTITYANFGNRELKPAITTSLEFGTELSLLQDRVSVEFNWYRQETTNSFFSVFQDPASGFIAAQQTNVGKIENAGIELSVKANVIREQNFDLSVRASYATLYNRLTDLGGSAPFAVGGFAYAQTRAEQGYPIGVLRVNVPRPDPDGVWRGSFDLDLRGSPVPSSFGAFGLDMTIFRDLSVSALVEYALGAQLLNQWRARRQVNAFGFRVVEAGSGETTYPVYPEIGESLIRNPLTNNAIYPRDPQSVSLLVDGSWVKFREISIRYRVPRALFGNLFSGITLSASVRNPLVIMAHPEVDPETQFIREGRGLNVGGIVGGTISNPRQFRIGIDVNL
ncbi:MAG: carboxypeptidase-like regulatory domain-containing protein [Chloroherpetonaceae bacterium]|nr:carboxypeptidase-like regulatory domain-containing protein [Chloroherpetonaceae bacterium]